MSAAPCPRPDKEAFASEEEARQRYVSILATDPKFALYRCVCGKWHGGNHQRNKKAHDSAMAPVPTIRTGLNAMPQPEPRRPRRQHTERHMPGKVQSTRVNPVIWKRALAAAGGDAHRIEVLSATSVRIHNDPGWRKQAAS